MRVNLPRWGLKLSLPLPIYPIATCKFTPLGFETLPIGQRKYVPLGVNLPRWGLKLWIRIIGIIGFWMCKFTPLGFETLAKARAFEILPCV